MSLTNADAATQFAELIDEFAKADTLDQTGLAAALSTLFGNWNLSNTALAQLVTSVAQQLLTTVSSLQVIGIKGVVALISNLPPGAAIGDAYLVLANGHGYAWIDGAWQDLGAFTGPQGIAGASVISTSGAPANTTGNNGDVAIDVAAANLYGPKANNIWPAARSIIGPQGAIGATGVKGDKGDQGDQGDQGVIGNTGPQGPGPFIPVTPWTSGSAYLVGPPASTVSQAGSSYVCLVAHVSGVTFSADLGAGKWGLVAAKGLDGNGSGNVNTSGAVTAGRVVTYADGSGNLLDDGGVMISDLEHVANKGMAGGYAALDGGGLVPAANLPVISVADIDGLGSAAVATVGVAGGDVVALDGMARLPAVDASQLTNLPVTASLIDAALGFAPGAESDVLALQREMAEFAIQIGGLRGQIFGLGDGFDDSFEDETGIDTGASTGFAYTDGDVNNMTTPTAVMELTESLSAMTSDNTPNGQLASDSSTTPGNAWMMFDHDVTTQMSAVVTNGVYTVKRQLTEPEALLGIAITLGATGAIPGGIQMYGSNTSGAQGPLIYQNSSSGLFQSSRGVKIAFSGLTTAYQYWTVIIVVSAGSTLNIESFEFLRPVRAPGAMALKSLAPVTLKAAPTRVALYLLATMGGGVLNTDLSATVSRDGATFTAGALAAISTIEGQTLYELQGSDGNPGVIVTGQPTGLTPKYVVQATATFRQDIFGVVLRAA